MKKSVAAASPDAYVKSLRGWRREAVQHLRKTVRSAAKLEEVIKWRNLVYFSNGPVLMIRAEPRRVLLGFWRGQRLSKIEPRLKAGGKFEMATMRFEEDVWITTAQVRRLVKAAVALNEQRGDPTR